VDVCSLRLPVSSVLLSLFVALHYSLSDDTNLNLKNKKALSRQIKQLIDLAIWHAGSS